MEINNENKKRTILIIYTSLPNKFKPKKYIELFNINYSTASVQITKNYRNKFKRYTTKLTFIYNYFI